MIERAALNQVFNELLKPEQFKDYGPNGLQVEGRHEIRKIVSGVTASLALIEAAVAEKADAIIVHHGLFWRGQTGVVTGWMRERLKLLLAHDINLFAYHLPLDAHPTLGNNAQLGQQLGLIGPDASASGNIAAVEISAPISTAGSRSTSASARLCWIKVQLTAAAIGTRSATPVPSRCWAPAP